MNDYFEQFEQSVGTALETGAQLPWYSRAWRVRHGRMFAAVFGALVIGTPAGAVTNCFGQCVPPRPQISVIADHVPVSPVTRQQMSLELADPSGARRPQAPMRQPAPPRQ